MDFKESGSGFVAVEKAEDSPLNLEESFAHGGFFFFFFGYGNVRVTEK